MCRDKDHGGRRCPRTPRSRELNTINRRIQRYRQKRDGTLSTVEREKLDQQIAHLEDQKKKAPRQEAALLLRGLLAKRETTERPVTTSHTPEPLLSTPVATEDEFRRLEPLSPRTRVVSVFRSGEVVVPQTRGVEAEVYAAADALRPEGRPGRTHSLYASPSLFGVGRWVRGNRWASSERDINVRELRVDPDTTYVYSVKAWERASWSIDEDKRDALYRAFWDSGMTLRQWYERGIDDGSEWELLIDPADVKAVKRVSGKRAAEAAGSLFKSEVAYILKDAARRHPTST